MRKFFKQIDGQRIWLLFLALTDVLAGFLLWLADVRAFFVLLGVMILGTLLLFIIASLLLYFSGKRRKEIFLDFLQNPTIGAEERFLQETGGSDREQIRRLAGVLRENQENNLRLLGELRDYEEYVEVWAHEVKTPLSLLTFLLDNRRNELPENLYHRLEYVRNRTQESITQILAFARLKGTTKDYQFEVLSAWECFSEVLEDYQVILEEWNFQVSGEGKDITVFSDQRGLIFMFSQVVSNAVKYTKNKEKPQIVFCARNCPGENCVEVSVRDNGSGVTSYDLPFIFEKGFTGEAGTGHTKATGMGLYLVRQTADDLKVTVTASSKAEQWFEIIFRFPVVEGTGRNTDDEKSTIRGCR